MSGRTQLAIGWAVAVGVSAGVRLWNALTAALMWGYDAWGHVAYVLFLDLYREVPYADQGWSFYQPPLHYALGWLLAQLAGAEALVRGLSLLGAAASLGIAGLAAWLARLAHPQRPWLALLAFCAVAFLPVHFTVGNMPGNEMTVAFFNTAAIAALVANERRLRPALAGDAVTGVLLGLAVLAKHTGFVAVLAVAGSLALRVGLAAERGSELRRVALRAGVVALALLAVGGPHYLRNLESYGKLIPTNRDYPLVSQIEAGQAPGERHLRDYATLSPRVIVEPNPMAPHMYRSVWGALYTNLWADTHRESDRERALEAERRVHPAWVVMIVVGLLPTGLALLGVGLAARDARAGRRRAIYLPLLLLSGAMVLAIVVFVWIVPRWSAMKAAYGLSLSLPFALFLARAVEELSDRAPSRLTAAVCAGLVAVAGASACVASDGLVLSRRHDSPASGAVRFYFGETEEARRVYGRLVAESGYKVGWLENLAAVAILEDRFEEARSLYARAVALAAESGRSDPRRLGRLAVAEALAGDRQAAGRALTAALAHGPQPELLANRGALRAAEGDLGGAIEDLRAALELDPEMVVAWLDLAVALSAAGDGEAAAAARHRAAEQACRAPRGYPFGVGTGEAVEWGVGRRWLLLLEDGTLGVAAPAFYRGACGSLGPRASLSGQAAPSSRTAQARSPSASGRRA